MSEPTQLAFVGCGGIAGQHLKGYADLYKAGCRDFEYVACCDVNEANARQRAKDVADVQGKEPQVFTSVEDLIASGVAEAADLCLPHWLHHTLGIQCLEGGLHTIVEKPIGITVKATRRIVEAAEKAGKIAAVAEQIRRFQAPRAFRWAIAEKKIIGDVHMVFSRQLMDSALNFDDYKFKWRGIKLLTGGGMIMDSGAHYADMMRYLFGPLDEAYCHTWSLDKRIIKDAPVVGDVPADVEDTWHAQLRFKSGVQATWIYGRSFHTSMDKAARYYGSEGTIIDDKIVFHPFQGGGTVSLRNGTEMTTEDVVKEYMASLSKDEKDRLFPYGVTSGFAVQTWDFVDAIRTGRKPEMDGMEGLLSKAICETCYESAHCGAVVKYDDVVSGAVCAFQKPVDEYWGI